MLNFYQEMVINKLHRYFPYDTNYWAMIVAAAKKMENKIKEGTEEDKIAATGTEREEKFLERSCLICCLDTGTVKYMKETEKTDESGSLWETLNNQCQNQNKITLREEFHQKLINKNILSTKSVIYYQGRTQKLTKRLSETAHNVPDAHRWGVLRKSLLYIYRVNARMIIYPSRSFLNVP